MKIAIIGTVAQNAVLFRKDMILALKEQNHEVYVFCVDYTNETRKQIESLGAITIDYTLNRAGLNPVRDIKDTINLSKKLKELEIDISFSYFVKPVIFGTIASKLAGVKKRFGMLEGLGYVFTDLPNGVSKKQKILRVIQVLLYKLSFPLLDKIIFLNPDDPKDLIKKYNIKAKKIEVLGAIGLNLDEYKYSKPILEKIRFIFIGRLLAEGIFESLFLLSLPLLYIQISLFQLKSPIKIRFIFIGRLLAEKGIFEYIEAAKIVKKDFSNIDFIVLGGLDEENPGGLKKHELDKLLEDNIIIYPGHVKDVNNWIKNSSVFVLPSYYREGVPRSTQEAMAIGRAVITTNVPGCRETVIEGLNGFFVPPFRADKLADKMKEFINNPIFIENMGEESHKIAKEKFDAKKVNNKLMKILEI